MFELFLNDVPRFSQKLCIAYMLTRRARYHIEQGQIIFIEQIRKLIQIWAFSAHVKINWKLIRWTRGGVKINSDFGLFPHTWK